MPLPHPSAQDLFTYGSLMCGDIMAAVAGCPLRSTPATLPGYSRFLVRDEQYPGVLAQAGGTVTGLVYHDIGPKGWLRLDCFEGEMYDRSPVTVRYANRTETQVYCYVFRPEWCHRLTATPWDYAAFLREGKQIFLNRYNGFKAIA